MASSTSWNKGAERIFGYTAEEAIGKPVTMLIPPERQDEEPAISNASGAGSASSTMRRFVMRKDGSRVDISLTVSPIKNAEGKIIGASKIARDITERTSASEAQIVVLAREAEHRAKNVLATVQATVQLYAGRHARRPQGAQSRGASKRSRTSTGCSWKSRWTGAELHSLVKEELAAYCQDGEGRAHIDGPNLLLQPDMAQTIAVTLHELATNAAKYGALSVPEGHVQVEWSHASDGQLVLRWTETGGPPVKPPTHQRLRHARDG